MAIRYRDLLAIIARAADVGMARPEFSAELAAVASHRIALLAGCDGRQTRDAVYVSLLQFAGCTSDARASASLTGNEMSMNGAIYGKVHHTEPAEMLSFLWELSAEQSSGIAGRLARFATVLSRLPGLLHTASAHCEVNDMMAERMGLDEACRVALGHVFEGWNGSGAPDKLRGEAIARPARIAAIADVVVPAHRVGGSTAIREVARRRAGRAFDPALADLVARNADVLADALSIDSPARTLRELDLEDEPPVDDAAIDALCSAVADFADLKCLHTRGRSPAIANLATAAAQMLRMPLADRELLGRAALLHATGRVGISVTVWDKPGPLDDAEWAQVRTYTLLTERVLRGSEVLASEAELATLIQERLDGTGYHRRLPPVALSVSARVLAAATVFHSLSTPRPDRPAVSKSQAAEMLRGEVEAGRLCGNATEAVIAAAGELPKISVTAPRGLTEREVEVLGLIARGLTNRQIADALGIAHKTAGNHVQNVLGKIGVSTRAAAAMFAMRSGLVSWEVPD